MELHTSPCCHPIKVGRMMLQPEAHLACSGRAHLLHMRS